MQPYLSTPHPLKAGCNVHMAGRKPAGPAEYLRRLADHAEACGARADNYGAGGFVADFEVRLADRLGQEAAMVAPTGAMTQLIAVRIAAERSGRPGLGMHPTSQIALNEHDAYVHLHRLEARFTDAPTAPPTPDAVRGVVAQGDVAVFVHELPYRQLGCVAPPLDQVDAELAVLRAARVWTHLDAARLFDAAPHYGVDAGAIAARFQSVYVSFYKSVGGFAGAALAGPRDFIEEARVWRRRHGGEMKQLTPIALAADAGLEAAIARAPQDWARAKGLAARLIAHGLTPRPTTPHAGTFHVVFDAPEARLAAARDAVAEAVGVWLFDYFVVPPGRTRPIAEVVASATVPEPDAARIDEALERFTSLLVEEEA